MKFLLIFILFVGAFGAPRKSIEPSRHSQRILGGIDAYGPTQFPGLVSIQEEDGHHFCGGSILDASTVLTAEGCNVRYYDYVVAGEFNLSYIEGHEQRIEVFRFEQHDDYHRNDVAVAILQGAFLFNDYVKPIRLPDSRNETYPVGAMTTIAGWGREGTSNSPQDDLHFIGLEITNFTECDEQYQDYENLDPTMMCAGYLGGGKGVCSGDYGGPLYAGYDESRLDYSNITQIAFCSTYTYSTCGDPRYPGVFVRVSYFFDFIAEYSTRPVPPP